jgi:WhiB family redox-sensing transcriptional regulator
VDDDWRKYAACHGMDNTDFFPDYDASGRVTGREQRAKAVCATCDVVPECLADALRNDERGIWGNTNDAERHAMQKRQR